MAPQLCVGKEVSFGIKDSITPSGSTNTLEFGLVYIAGVDLAKAMVESGWAKVKESKDENDRKSMLQQFESQAKDAKKGLWDSDAAVSFFSRLMALEARPNFLTYLQPIETSYTPPSDMQHFVSSHKGKDVDGLVEQVQSGALLRVRLMIEPTKHQVVNVQMAGIRAPRAPQMNASGADDSNAEACGAEARFFTESRLLQRNVGIELLGFPPSSFSTPGSAPIVGVVKHPAGSISTLLTSFGFARCVDLHAALLGANRMSELRKVEQEAKEARKGLWKTVTPASTGGPKSKGYEAVVSRVFSGDTIFIRTGKDGSGPEKRISFSSVRQPRRVSPMMVAPDLPD